MIASMGGVDLQLLGLGHDGHIGFNEPNDEFDKETHCVDLTEMTIEADKRFFNSIDEIPRSGIYNGRWHDHACKMRYDGCQRQG